MNISDQLFNKLISLINDLIEKTNDQDRKIKELSEMIKTSNLYINEYTQKKIETNKESICKDPVLNYDKNNVDF